eukprot:Sdes_comp20982_c0_seq5m19324
MIQVVLSSISLAIAGICYWGYSSRCKTARILEQVPVYSLKSLYEELQQEGSSQAVSSSKYVLVNGSVVVQTGRKYLGSTLSANNLLFTQYAKTQQKCVIYSLTVKEHVSEWLSASRSWEDVSRIVSNSFNYTPFSVSDGSDLKFAAQVLDPLRATHLGLITAYDHFAPNETTASQVVVNWLSGEKSKGFQHIERILPLHAKVYVVAEAALGSNGYEIDSRFLLLDPPRVT